MIRIKCDTNQQYLKTVNLHFVKFYQIQIEEFGGQMVNSSTAKSDYSRS